MCRLSARTRLSWYELPETKTYNIHMQTGAERSLNETAAEAMNLIMFCCEAYRNGSKIYAPGHKSSVKRRIESRYFVSDETGKARRNNLGKRCMSHAFKMRRMNKMNRINRINGWIGRIEWIGRLEWRLLLGVSTKSPMNEQLRCICRSPWQ